MSDHGHPMMSVAPAVADAIAEGKPVVALESTLISHGLPRPDNLRVARDVEDAVRAEGAVPATIAIIDGTVRVGLDGPALEEIAHRDSVAKLSARDVPIATATGATGATTVAATAHLAARAGIRVFATGGLGGVHREARETYDESGDLHALARTDVVVVCAGVKSILDVPATLERLETLGVSMIGYRTTAFPGFYVSDSGHRLQWRVHRPADIAEIVADRRRLGLDDRALVVANPLPEDRQLDPELHDRVLRAGLERLAAEGVTGADVTPFLLEHVHRATSGASLTANIHLILGNARLGAEIARACAA